MNASVLDCVQECLQCVTSIYRESADTPAEVLVRDCDRQRRLSWLNNQLTALMSQLQGIALDLQSGLSIRDLGYSSNDELYETLEDIEREVRQIRVMMREVNGLGR